MLFTPAALTLFAAAHPAPMAAPTLAPLIEPAPIAAFFPPAPLAEGEGRLLSYTYVELGWQSTDLDAIGEDADGLKGRASLALFDILHVFLDYTNSSTDVSDVGTDAWALGVGAHFSVSPKFDAIGELSWLLTDTEGLDSENGWSAFAGGRWMAMDWDRGGLEVNGGFRWIEVDNFLSDDSVGAWELGARVHFLQLFSVGATYVFLEDDTQWYLTGRVSF